MPRPKNSVPQKRAHISGQDRVYLHGKHYYLGPSGSEEAHTRYDALVAIYLSNDRTMPEDTPSHQAELSPTVAHITQVFRGAIKTKYANVKQGETRCACAGLSHKSINQIEPNESEKKGGGRSAKPSRVRG